MQLEELESAESREMPMSGHDENVEALPYTDECESDERCTIYRCIILYSQSHMGRPPAGYPNPCRYEYQLYHTLGSLFDSSDRGLDEEELIALSD